VDNVETPVFSAKNLNVKPFVLTVLLFGLLVFYPLLPGSLVNSIFLGAMMVAAWLASGKSRMALAVVMVLGLSTVLLSVVQALAPDRAHNLLQQPVLFLLVTIILVSLFYCGGVILRSLLKTRTVSANEILGTINLYLILGFIWSYVYLFLEKHHPGSFNLTVSDGQLAQKLLYFSFTTLTTLGYGDITPQTPTAQMPAVMEAIIGQFYVAIVVTYLLSLYISQKLGK